MRFEGLLLHEAALLAAPDTCDLEAGRAYYYTTKILLTSHSHMFVGRRPVGPAVKRTLSESRDSDA